jgi:SAM-dependent methyltransferase
MTARVDLYDSAYTNFARPVEAAVRAETYGEDIGQSSWITAAEWASYFAMLDLRRESEVLEVGCGSGGPAAYLARTVGCRVVGVDVNEAGIANATALAERAGLAERARFRVVDGSGPLPFADASFDAVVVSLVLCSVPNQASALAEIRRVLRPGGELRVFEHVIADHPVGRAVLRGAQATFWPRLCGNCHPARDTSAAIRAAGFETEALRRFTLRPGGLSPPMPVIVGRAPIAGRPSA